MQYTVAIVPRAEKEFLALPSAARNRVREKILALEDNSKPFGSKKLRQTDYYRLRTGDYRIVYSVNDEKKVVTVLSIAHRKEVYR